MLAFLGEPLGVADSACVFADRNGCPEAGGMQSAVEADASSGSLSDVACEADGTRGIGNGNPDGDPDDGDAVDVSNEEVDLQQDDSVLDLDVVKGGVQTTIAQPTTWS